MNAARAQRAAAGLIPAMVLALTALAHTQDEAGDPARLIDALGLRTGMVVGEIGAGDGALTIALARHVGETGAVFTTELGGDRVNTLRAAVERAALPQVQVRPAAASSTNLEAGCCDALVMRDVYHHFEDPAAMNASLFATVRPGGRLAVLDFASRDGVSGTPGERASGGQHGIASDAIVSELTAAGFVDVTARAIAGRRYMVTARRPSAPGM
jgi:predicted methyltransferase